MFGVFKRKFQSKKEPIKTDYEVTDLEVGFVLDYDMQSWKVAERYEYDWGDEEFSREYKLVNGKTQLFLAVEDGDELELTLNTKRKLRELGNHYEDIVSQDKDVNQLEFDGEIYWMEERSPGYFNEYPNDEWVELISTTYYNKEGDKVLTLEQWGEGEYELSSGKVIKAFEISNILPAS